MRHACWLACLLLALVPGCSIDDLSIPQGGSWGFGIIDSMKTPPDDLSLGCGAVIPPDSKAEERGNCAFGSGARVSETLGIPSSTLATVPIRHVIILMKENRSFDHLLGRLSQRGQPGAENAPPGYSNPGADGVPVFPFHATTTCIPSGETAMARGLAPTWIRART